MDEPGNSNANQLLLRRTLVLHSNERHSCTVRNLLNCKPKLRQMMSDVQDVQECDATKPLAYSNAGNKKIIRINFYKN